MDDICAVLTGQMGFWIDLTQRSPLIWVRIYRREPSGKLYVKCSRRLCWINSWKIFVFLVYVFRKDTETKTVKNICIVLCLLNIY